MFGLPLHPLIVHFPIVLTALLPVFTIVAFYFIRKGAAVRRAWLVPLVASAALFTAAWVTKITGQQQEDRVEKAVPRAAFHEHEEAGEMLWMVSGALLVITAAGMAHGGIGKAARVVSVAGSIVLIGAAIKVGHTGGVLVYKYDAARVYSAPDSSPPATPRYGDH